MGCRSSDSPPTLADSSVALLMSLGRATVGAESVYNERGLTTIGPGEDDKRDSPMKVIGGGTDDDDEDDDF